MAHALGQLLLAAIVIGVTGAALIHGIGAAAEAMRGGREAGPRAGRGASRPGAPRAAGGKAAGGGGIGRSLLDLAAHPGSRHIRAQARADAHRMWQQAMSTDWLEDRRHQRQQPGNGAANGNGSSSAPGTVPVVTGGTTATQGLAPKRALATRLRNFIPGKPGGPDRNGNGHGGNGNGAGGSTPAVPGPGARSPAGPPPAAVPPPPAPHAPSDNGTPGRTTPVAGTSTASAEKLIEGINEIYAHAAAGNIHAKREALKAIHEAAVRFAAMLTMLARAMSEPGSHYGPEITEPVAKAAQHQQASAMTISEGDQALTTLINTTLGDLAQSPRQAPHHNELTESGAH